MVQAADNTESPVVSIVIPVLNEERNIRDTVDSILSQDYPHINQICLALGPSVDRTNLVVSELLLKDSRICSVENPSGGRSSGLNAAIRATSGEIIVRVDGHSKLPEGYVSQAVKSLVQSGAANVGGIQRAVGRTRFETSVSIALQSRFGMGGSHYRTGGVEGSVDTVYLGTFLRTAVERIGLFDESLEGNEDYELNIRLRKSGGIVWFDPALVVDYVPRSDLVGLFQQYFSYGRWKRQVIVRHPTYVRPRQLVPPLAVLGIFAGLLLSGLSLLSLIVPLMYFFLTLLVALWLGFSSGLTRSVFVALIVMHLSWGIGFLIGNYQFHYHRFLNLFRKF